MKIKLLQAFLLVLLFFGCNTSYKDSKSSTLEEPNTLFIIKDELTKINYSEVFDSVKYVVLDTSDDILLSEVTRLKCLDSCIYVLDERTQTLFSFSMNGKMNWKIQDKGRGPDEYYQLRDFDIDCNKKEIYLFSTYDKILVYNFEGDFLHAVPVKLSGSSFAINSDTMYMYNGGNKNPTGGMDESFDIIRITADQKLKGYMPNENALKTVNIYYNSNAFCKVNNELRFYKPFSTNIYSIANDTSNIQYRFDFGEYNMPESYFDEHTPRDLGDSKYAFALNSYWENNRYCSFNIIYNQQFHTILYNKNNNVLHDSFYDDLGYCFPQIHEATDEYVLGCRSVEELMMEYKFKKEDRKGTVLESVISQIGEDSNPVVFFYYFKK
jgi:hypothetical protein